MQKQDPQFWFIELLAWWEGRINTRPLMRYFGQSRQSASAHIVFPTPVGVVLLAVAAMK